MRNLFFIAVFALCRLWIAFDRRSAGALAHPTGSAGRLLPAGTYLGISWQLPVL
ncbi:hypothetical protein ABIF63_009328 [Bradyrhizobium japonicum]|jgi:hypothetical protein|uniref:NolL n=1 Tax=Bradyrhizobium japonicum TaxID=375 RepID=A0ABV2S7Q7_BRAJP